LIIVTDLESTSLNVFEAEIITGYFCLLDENLKIVDTRFIQCNPFKWSDEAEKIHRITRSQAAKYKKFSEVYQGLIDWINLSGATEIWCHSNSKMYGKIVPYDYAVLRMNMLNMSDSAYWTINKLKPYSSHSLAKTQNRFTFESNSLDNICKQLGIRLTHHDAESDCRATVEIIKRLLPMTSREEIYNYERGINEDFERPIKRNSRKSKPSFGAIDQLSDNIN
jgi:DNA polymerase III epsilon subunit-like protein